MKQLATITIASLALTTAAIAGDAGKGAPAVPQKADKVATPPPAAAPEMPKPPQELADAAKMMTGTWKCSGQAFMDMKDPTKGTDIKATMTHKLDLGNFWIQSTLSGQGKFALKFTMYTTYDASTKKWIRLGADNMGGSRSLTSAGPKDNKIVWEGEGRSMMGTAKIRDTEEMTKDGDHASGEVSMDGGKTWVKTHDVVCKK